MKKIRQIVILTTLVIPGCASSQKKLEAQYRKCINSEEKRSYLYRLSEREKVCKKEIWGK